MFNYAGIPMPDAVPGVSAPLPNRVQSIPLPGPAAGPSPLSAIHTGGLGGPIPPQIANAIKAPSIPAPGNEPPMIPAPPSPNPHDHGWDVETQSDGTLLLRIKMANGELGPVVKIISGVKVPGAE